MPTTDRKLRVFLCHSSQDKPIIREIYQQLLTEGWINPWLDEEELLPGQDWDMEIEKAVEASDAVIVCLSDSSVKKEGYIQKELRFALNVALEKPEEAIFIIPLRLDECFVPRSIKSIQYIDYFPGDIERSAYLRVLKSLILRAKNLGLQVLPDQSQIQVWGDIRFVKVPNGLFLMGSREENPLAWATEKPQRSVDITYDYWISRFPITNAQFARFTEQLRQKLARVDTWDDKLDCPVVNVSWDDAQSFCKWFNDTYGRELFRGLVCRLPLETEWEKAARGIDGREWPWGNEFDKNKCNSSESSMNVISSVGAYSPEGDSPYSCCDMAGNVWEWVIPSSHSPYGLPEKMVRGGSFKLSRRRARTASSDWHISSHTSDDCGFRIVAAPSISLEPLSKSSF